MNLIWSSLRTAGFLAAAAFVVFILVSLSNFRVDFEGVGGRSAQQRKSDLKEQGP